MAVFLKIYTPGGGFNIFIKTIRIINMITLFFITFFIAELIIFGAVILKVLEFNKLVNTFNLRVTFVNEHIRDEFFDFRVLVRAINFGVIRLSRIIREKRDEYIFSMVKNALVYGGAFFLKGKWANFGRLIAAYNIGKEVYNEIKEA